MLRIKFQFIKNCFFQTVVTKNPKQKWLLSVFGKQIRIHKKLKYECFLFGEDNTASTYLAYYIYIYACFWQSDKPTWQLFNKTRVKICELTWLTTLRLLCFESDPSREAQQSQSDKFTAFHCFLVLQLSVNALSKVHIMLKLCTLFCLVQILCVETIITSLQSYWNYI